MATLEVISDGFQASVDDYDRQHALGIQLKDEDQLPPVTTRTRSVSLSQRAELMVVEELSVDSQAPNAIYNEQAQALRCYAYARCQQCIPVPIQ